MALLIVGLVIFLGVHSVRIVADDWRTAQIAKRGPKAWKGIYSVLSLIGFVLIVYGYGLARQVPAVVYAPPAWLRHLGTVLTIPAFILVAAAYVPGTRIKRAVGHPMVLGVKVWAVAHLLANGAVADLVLFGSILVWAVVNYAAARRRDRAAGTVYAVGPVSRDARAVVIGLVVWAIFAFWLHGVLIGPQPFG
jgi:uncharacterized membrane protein